MEICHVPFFITSTYLLQLLVAEYIREINIIFYLSLMFICTLVVLKKKGTEIEKEIVKALKYASDCRKKAGK